MSTERYLELKKHYATLSDEREKIRCLIEIVLEIRNYDLDEAYRLSNEIIERSYAADFPEGVGRGLNHKGACYWLRGEYEKGLNTLKEALKIARDHDFDALRARIYNNYGNIYRDLGELSNASKYYQWALEISEKVGDELAQSAVLISISNLHFDLFDYDNALDYAKRCLEIFRRYDDKKRLIQVYHTLGNIYLKKEELNLAIINFKRSLVLSEPNTVGNMLANSGIGKVYYKMGMFEKAERYLQMSMRQSQELGNFEGIIISEFYLGRIAFDLGDYSNALGHLDRSFDLANEHSRRHDIMSIHEMYAKVYEKMGDIVEAYQHLKTYERLKEEIIQQQTLNRLHNLQIRHEIEFAVKEKELAEQSARLKQQFIANMSHEIRTPMNAIVGMTRLLMEKNPRPDQVKYLDAITRSADNLLVIINDILDFSKIEAGKITIEFIDFSLKSVLKNVVTLLRFKAEEKGIAIRFDLEGEVPDSLVGDPTRLNQVLMNLAGNAVKFTEQGSVQILVRVTDRQPHFVQLAFDVKDTGIGIPQDFVNRIFESFTQAGTDVARKYGGTGLGLTISRQLVELMEGTISVQSKLGEGTTFTFVLPFQLGDEQKINRGGEFHLQSADVDILNRSRILLVDDNEFNTIVAVDTLKAIAPRMQIAVASSGYQAMELLREHGADLVLMDIQMPQLSGTETTRLIRDTFPDELRRLPILAMTANVMRQDIEQYLQAGMNDHIPKPFQKEELVRKILRHLNRELVSKREPGPLEGEGNADLARVESTMPVAPPVSGRITDPRFLMSFAGQDVAKQKKYVQIFLQNAPRLLEQVMQGSASGDYEKLKIAAHSLKTQLNYMGVKEEMSHVYELEQLAAQRGSADQVAELAANLQKVCERAFAELEEMLKG